MKPDILLVEDNPEDATLALRVLKQDNPKLKIKHLNDGVEALNYLFDDSDNTVPKFFPRVIFLDIKLPKLTGPEVLKVLKSNELTRYIPVVVMTSSSQQKDVMECYRLGANSYLVKPIDFKSYHALIINSSRYWLNYNIAMPV